MPRVACIGREAHDRGFAVAKAMRQPFGLRVALGPLSQITTEGSSKIHPRSPESPPFPELLPHLDQRLDLFGTG